MNKKTKDEQSDLELTHPVSREFGEDHADEQKDKLTPGDFDGEGVLQIDKNAETMTFNRLNRFTYKYPEVFDRLTEKYGLDELAALTEDEYEAEASAIKDQLIEEKGLPDDEETAVDSLGIDPNTDDAKDGENERF